MAKMNLDYYTNLDQYSDGDIENEMLKIAKEGKSLEDLADEEIQFPIVYHFSKVRENILKWYPFKKDASVLEIGAGCGAITGMLCEKAGKVTSVELSMRRASINFARHQQCDNLEIMVGNLNDMVIKEKYDYVVLNGVLEYAAGFTDGEKPYHTFLQNMKKYLKPDGRFLIAIENRLGLKYFSGAPEDHTDIYFYGLDRYPNNNTVRTFSKTELRTLLEENGLSVMRFYYPYPDYKFPFEIFTDETIDSSDYGRAYKNYTEDKVALFDENLVAHDLAREGVADVFANSFLVEAGMQTFAELDQVLYVKINRERKEEFQTYTAIYQNDKEKYVVKEAITEPAIAFVNQVAEYGHLALAEGYENLSCECKNGQLKYPFVKSKNMMDEIYHFTESNNKDAIVKLLKDFYKKYFAGKEEKSDIYSEDFEQVFGNAKGHNSSYECVSPANVDLICDNIFIDENASIIIDYEWIFNFPVPVSFIMWRMINEMYHKEPRLYDIVEKTEFFDMFQISEADEETFLEWSKHFAYEYVGSDSHMKYAVESKKIDLNEILGKEKEHYILDTKLYYDTGHGLNEAESISKKVKLNGNRFKVKFELPENVIGQYYRWDIQMNSGYVYIDRLNSNCRFDVIPNGECIAGKWKFEFIGGTPSFIIDTVTPKEIRYVEFEGRVRAYKIEDLVEDKAVLKNQLNEKIKEKESAQGTEKSEKTKKIVSKDSLRDVKKTVKNIVKRYKISPKGCVDTFVYENNVLHCRGWVFDEVYPIRDAKVVYYENGRPIYQHKYTINYRNDVAKALGNKDAQNCGFYFMAQIHSKKALTLVLEYETEVGKGKFALGKVPADPECGRLEIEVCDGIGQIGNLDKFVNSHLVDDYVVHGALYEQEIDVIIPVYNGYEYFDELFKSVEQTNMKYRLLIVNDKSPDERVLPYLENYAASHENAILLNNEQNLGFVRSVNRALKEAKNHVVLLNTDVVVPYQWLERLMTPIVCGDKIATTTPYTTCGTLCSFPEIGKDNTLVADLSMWQMDNVFRTIKPKYPEIPTGVGFCMGMNKDAIREVGYLDEENFGKGYGEENDWCRRAVKCGYKNVHVDNMFAYHKHGGSFLSEEKKALLEKNSKTLLSKHPDYNKVVASYFSADPLKTTRYYVYMQLLNRMTSVKTVLAFNHNWGGGATEYLVKKQKEYLRDGYKFIILTYDSDNDKYLVDYRYKEEKIGFASDNLETALNNIGRVDEIWINEIVTYRDLYETMRQIRMWKKEQGAELRMLLHDYFAICPAVNLMDYEGKYCNVGNQEQCQHCIPNNSKNTCAEFCSAAMWRQNWQKFLESCDKVVAFSEISRSLLKKAYPSLNNIVLIPHEPYFVPALNKKVKTTKTLNIGLLGILTYNKGLNVVKAMVEEIEKQNLDVRLKLIGAADEVPDSKVFSQTGRYRREDLPRLTLEQDIDIFFIPAIWPETFSYTTSEIMSMNMPIAVFNIGAPVERVSKYEKGLVLECDASVSEIVEKIVRFAKEDCAIEHMPVDEEKTLFLAQEVSFASRYRVEHFREQLIYQGYPSDYYQIQDADNIDISQYKNVVIYRCSDVERVAKIVEKAKKAHIPVYYDIDDFIFDYEQISYLEFLKDEEYKSFAQKTENIHKCMDMCDGYLTSTEMLKKQISEHFPLKNVTMKRNVASMAMQILSHNAVVEKPDNGDKIWIGYFSGSATHNKDFELIEGALDEIMVEYPNVYLKLGGVIQDSIINRYPNRVEKLPFMDWQKLPTAVASCDINLMPLEDSVFHCCKSENKWMEAALVEVPSVMSRNDEMEKVVEHSVTGMLCTTKDEWKQAMVALIEDKTKRQMISKEANRVVLEKYVTQTSGKEAIALLEKE